MPELDYIPLFLDFYERYAGLTYEERGRLVWAMLAYARDEDPDPHLTEVLRRYVFSNEKGIIDRTSKTFTERKERRKEAAKTAANARWQSDKSSSTDANGCNRMQTHANACDPCHNNNYNYNNNKNNNNNKGGARTYGSAGTGAARAHAVGKETIL